MICFYHDDLDGICSAAIVYYKYRYVELFPINYGEPFPWEKINKDDTVFMVDFGLQPIEDMVRLDKICNLIWIDHHITAIKAAEEIGFNPLGLRENGKAGCELTWEYCFPDIQLPWPVYYLGRYDVWDHTNKWTLPFQYGMRYKNWTPDCYYWEHLFVSGAEFQCNIIDDGEIIIKWEKNQNARRAKNSFETEFEGLKAIVCQGNGGGSPLFDSVYNEDKHDIMISFIYLSSGKWTYSLYSTKEEVDCGALAQILAKKYNGSGGGHFSASGIVINKFLF